MKIEWKYLNKKTAAIDAMQDYAAMEYVILNYKDDVEEEQAQKTSVKTGPVRLTSNSRNPQGGEARLVATLDTIDLLAERYHTAVEYMAWFQPAWNMLTEAEKLMLSEFYVADHGSKEDAIQCICTNLAIERTSAYRKKDAALAHLAMLLYGY